MNIIDTDKVCWLAFCFFTGRWDRGLVTPRFSDKVRRDALTESFIMPRARSWPVIGRRVVSGFVRGKGLKATPVECELAAHIMLTESEKYIKATEELLREEVRKFVQTRHTTKEL